MEKKKKIVKISILAIFIILITLGGYLSYEKIYLPSQKEYIVKIHGDNDILLDKLTFKKDSYIQVLDQNKKVQRKIKLNENTKTLILENAKDTDNLLFNGWEFEKKVDKKEEFYKKDIVYFNAKPTYDNKEDFVLKFIADEKAIVLVDEQKVTYLNKPYTSETSINDYLPEVMIEKDYKGDWVIGDTIVDENTIIDKDSILQFKTYQDKNNNSIDDFTEEFTIDFVTNIEQNVDSRVVKWEGKIELPKLEDESKIFYEWYVDEDYKREFTEQTKVTDNLTLYAKVKGFKEIINETIEDPIDRKDIGLQVKKMLEKRNKSVDQAFNKEIENKDKERAELKKYNQENNIVTQDIQVEINLQNLEHNKLHLVNFVDPLNKFIYSLVLPYGQTIKVVNENGNIYQEYAVRQNTTIVLDEKQLVSNTSKLDKYDSEYRQINDSVFVKIQPTIK